MLNDESVRGESWETRYSLGLREGYHYLSVTANTSDVCADLKKKVRVDHDRNRRPPLPFSLRHIKSDSFGTVDSVIEVWACIIVGAICRIWGSGDVHFPIYYAQAADSRMTDYYPAFKLFPF